MWIVTLLFCSSGIKGVVTDGKEALIEATVKVTAGSDTQVLTDIDGNYTLDLPAGTYDLRVFYDVYKPRRITGVEVKEGEYARVNVKLTADDKAVEEVVVEAKKDKRSAAALLTERKKAAVVQDSLGAQDIQRTPDTNASEAVRRVVSATVVDNKYLLVRGIGGRYSQTLLNGAELPSPEPDEAAVPLDLFPTALLSNLTVIKTHQSDLPGTFAGGVGLIETNSYPSKLELRFQLRAEYNSETTLREILGSSPGAGRLPGEVPRTQGVSQAVSEEERARIAKSFPNNWGLVPRLGAPSWAVNAMVGNTFALPVGKLGLLASLSYSSRDLARAITTNTTQAVEGAVRVRDSGVNNYSSQSQTIGGLLNLAYQIDTSNEINLFTLYTRNSDNQANAIDGYSESLNADISATRQYVVQREMIFSQVRGTHRASAFEIDWQGNFSNTQRDEPDVRDLLLVKQEQRLLFRQAPNSGERYFSDLWQPQGGGFLHLSYEVFSDLKLRMGARATYTWRTFSARRFRMEATANAQQSAFGNMPEDLFTPSTIGSDFNLREFTFSTDAYRAAQIVGAGFAMADYKKNWFRAIAGVRYEGSRQDLESGSPVATQKEPAQNVNRADNDVLPSVNFVFSLSDNMNVRAGYSYTLARPRFRELAPFVFYDFARRRSVSGNPQLQVTHIHNADLRWEWFPNEQAVLAASVFYKNFNKPIETVVYDATDGSVTFANTSGAHLAGAELEARTALGAGFSLSANLTGIWSQVTLGDEARQSTNRSRPLQGQSPYIANATLSWATASNSTELAVLYNVYGPRLMEVGFESLPDVFEQEVHRLDFNASQALAAGFRLKLSATNLAYQPITLKQGNVVVQKFQPGVNVLLALEWAL